MTWVSLHVFYHGDLDSLLCQAVRPLLAKLRRSDLIDAYFFLRYWDGGPHLRLRLRPCGEPATVRHAALMFLRDYLARHPSVDQELSDYAGEAAMLAKAEKALQYLEQPLPNNTVHEIPYHPENERYGHGASLAAVERHFVESSRIALGLVTAGTSHDQRHTVAFATLLLTRNAFNIPTVHADPQQAELRKNYAENRHRLRVLATQVEKIAAGTSHLASSGALNAWWNSVVILRNDLRRVGMLADRAGYIAHLCAHLLCNRLGLSLADEAYVHYLAASAANDQSP